MGAALISSNAIKAEENYFLLPDISNSDLSWLKLETNMSGAERFEFRDAYRMGSLVDAMITETHRVNYFHYTLDDECYTASEFQLAEQMKKAFKLDSACIDLLRQSTGQMVKRETVNFEYGGFEFNLNMRCKYDLWIDALKWGADIKSTTARTQKEFEAAVRHFDYDRQRAVYMKISGAQKDMLIGISKVNFKIFKIPIRHGDPLHTSGVEKMNELSFRWWCYFDNFKKI